ncbi:MAG: DUF1015 domain-containing protein [Planctomycetes bacterium]|nr:DUF1015 domain-containing protein [Planctomycetota bacterium]
MLDVHPFHGWTYDLARVGDLSRVVTQPYDKIDLAMIRAYREASPWSAVRLIREPPGEAATAWHTGAASTLESWCAQGVLRRAPEAAFYAYHQVYPHEGRTQTRRALIAALSLRPWGREVMPHERTLRAPLEDRLRLTRATRANLEPVFLLHSGDAAAVEEALVPHMAQGATMEATIDGTVHRVWPVGDPEAHRRVRETLAGARAVVADGHHRYETSLAYAEECRAAGIPGTGPEGHGTVLTALVAMDDPGLTVLPTHRLVRAAPADLPSRLERQFEWRPHAGDLAGLCSAMAAARPRTAFGLVAEGGRRAGLLLLREGVRVPGPGGDAYRRLDVTVLHRLVLEGALGLGEEAVREGGLAYERHAADAQARVREGAAACAFLLNPTGVAQVREVAEAGERLPQKTTDFYPKMITGLVFRRMGGG